MIPFTTKLNILYALNTDGKILWQTVMGRAWTGSNPESRAMPTVENNRVYTTSGFGDLACIDGTTGKIIWSQIPKNSISSVVLRLTRAIQDHSGHTR